MRAGSQIQAIVEQALNSALFSLEATIVSVSGGQATVQPSPKRIFGDNSEPIAYPAVENVRLFHSSGIAVNQVLAGVFLRG